MSGAVVMIGAGRMGGAILRGLQARPEAGRQAYAVDPNAAEAPGATLVRSVDDLPDLEGALVVVAVKPYAVAELLPALRRLAGAGGVFVTIAAGITLETMRKGLGDGVPAVRAMPNTPAGVMRGITGVYAGPEVGAEVRDRCQALFEGIGEVVWLDEEWQIDAVTAVSGSGPAYLFRFGEAMARAGEALGLSPEVAMRLARRTLEGAGALAFADPRPLAELRVEVTSPGGTTAAALERFEALELDATVEAAVRASFARAKELGQG